MYAFLHNATPPVVLITMLAVFGGIGLGWWLLASWLIGPSQQDTRPHIRAATRSESEEAELRGATATVLLLSATDSSSLTPH